LTGPYSISDKMGRPKAEHCHSITKDYTGAAVNADFGFSEFEGAIEALTRPEGRPEQLTSLLARMMSIADSVDELDGAGRTSWRIERQRTNLRFFAQQLLMYSIEDEAIDLRDEAPRVAKALAKFIKNDDVSDLFKIVIDFRKKKPIEVSSGQMCSEDGTRFRARMPMQKEELIPVSSVMANIAPILEDSIADPHLAPRLIGRFAELVSEMADASPVSCLCFIEKAVGPVGAISLLGSLVERTGLPSVIYRPRYLEPRGRLSGVLPTNIKPGKQTAVLVYDLFVTGAALNEAAEDLKSKYGIDVVGAVVLFSYVDDPHLSGGLPVRCVATNGNARVVENENDVSVIQSLLGFEPVLGGRTLRPTEGSNVEVSDHATGGQMSKDALHPLLAKLDKIAFAPDRPGNAGVHESLPDSPLLARLDAMPKNKEVATEERRISGTGAGMTRRHQSPLSATDVEKVAQLLGAERK
jgi:hypothetical protein